MLQLQWFGNTLTALKKILYFILKFDYFFFQLITRIAGPTDVRHVVQNFNWKMKRGKRESTQEAVLARVTKAKRWSGLIESLELTKRRIACFIASSLVIGFPLKPVDFISTSDSASTSTQNIMSSLLMRIGGNVNRPAPELSPSIPSIDFSSIDTVMIQLRWRRR